MRGRGHEKRTGAGAGGSTAPGRVGSWRPRRRGRRWLRALRVGATILAALVGVVAVGAASAWIYARSARGQARLATMVTRALHDTVPGLRIGRLGPAGQRGGGLAIDDLAVYDEQGVRAIHVRRADVRPRWRALLGRQLILESVRVEGLAIDARMVPRKPSEKAASRGAAPAEGTQLNLATLVHAAPAQRPDSKPPGPSSGASPLRGWSVGRIEIVDGKAAYRAADVDGAVTATFGLVASAAGEGEGEASTARIGIDDLQVRVVGLPGRDPIAATLAGQATFAKGALDARLTSSVDAGAAGHLSLDGAVTLPDGNAGIGNFHVVARVADVSLAAVAPGTTPGRISGRVSASGTGVPLQAGSHAAITVELSPSRVGGVEIADATASGETTGPRWSLARLAIHAERLSVRGSGEGAGATGHAHLEVDVASARPPRPRGHRSELRLSAIRGRGHLVADVDSDWPRGVRVHLAGQVQGLEVVDAGRVGRARLAADAAVTRGADWSLVSRGHLQVADVASPAILVDAATVSWATRGPLLSPVGTLTAEARSVRSPRPGGLGMSAVALNARGDGRRLVVSARVVGPGGQGSLEAEVRRGAREIGVTLSRAEVAFRTGAAGKDAVQQVALTGPAGFVLRPTDDEVAVSGLHVRADGPLGRGDVLADGTFAWPGPRRARARGQIAIGVRGASVRGLPAIDAEVVAALADDRATAKLHAWTTTTAKAKPAEVRAAVAAPISFTTKGVAMASTGPLAVSVESADVDLAALPPLQQLLGRWGLTGGRFNVRASVTGDVADPRGSVAVDVRQLEYRDVTGNGRDAAIHRVPGIGVALTVASSAHRIQVSNRLTLYGGGFATTEAELHAGLTDLLRGVDWRRVPLTARLEIPRFQIGAFRSLSDELRDTTGWLSARAELSGSLAQPRGVVDLRLDEGRVDQIALGPVTAHAEADGKHLRGTVQLRTGAAGTLVATAAATLMSAGAPSVKLKLDARGVDPGFVRPFVTGVRELGGVIDAQVTAEGLWPRPAVKGRVYYYQGRVGITGEPTFHDINVAAAFAPGRLDVESLVVHSGDGVLTGKGHATLEGMQLATAELTAHARRFLVAAGGISGGRLDGELQVRVGRGGPNSLTGTATVPTATVWLPGLSLGGRKVQRVKPHDDVRFVDGASRAAAERDAARPPSAPTTVTLRGEANTIYVRAKDVDLELTSRLVLQTTATGEPALFGEIRFRRGRIAIGSQRFELDDSRIIFDGGVTPRLDLRLAHAFPEATVTVELRGTAARPELRFRSDPPIYDQAQIVSLVLTGHLSGAPGGPAPDPTALIASTVLGKLADKLAPQLGLDVLKVERSAATPEQQSAGLLSERVEIGKYVSERVYVSYAHVFGATDTQNTNEAQAEYRLSADWMAQTVFGDAGVGGVDAFWTRRY